MTDIQIKKEKLKTYTTDNRVVHKAKDEDIIHKIGKVLGKKFTDYRKEWDAVNKFEKVTEFPLFFN